MSGVRRGARPRPSEREVVRIVAAHLESLGYRVRADPDGSDYFDLVARRGEEIGLIEAKVSDARTVLTQALKRRAWGDWCAVALAGERSARRLAARTAGTRAEPVGVWCLRGDQVEVVRSHRPWVLPGRPDPYAPLRARFRAILDALEDGTLPPVPWDGVLSAVRRASGGRGFAEWRLDEIGDSAPE